jgi:HSP20 family protein
MDLHENQEKNTVTATFELPGLKKENVNIDINNDRLTISGEASEALERNQDGYVVKERSSGKFSRSIGLPAHTQVWFPTLMTLHAQTVVYRSRPSLLQWKMVF